MLNFFFIRIGIANNVLKAKKMIGVRLMLKTKVCKNYLKIKQNVIRI